MRWNATAAIGPLPPASWEFIAATSISSPRVWDCASVRGENSGSASRGQGEAVARLRPAPHDEHGGAPRQIPHGHHDVIIHAGRILQRVDGGQRDRPITLEVER